MKAKKLNGFNIFLAAYVVSTQAVHPANPEMMADPLAYTRKICASYDLTDEVHIGLCAGLAHVFMQDLAASAAAIADQVEQMAILVNGRPITETIQ